MHGTHLTCGSLVLAVALAGQGLGAAPDRADSGACIGVLGAVAYPGAYEFEANEVELETALRAAGGVREDADETVRVIRDGRVWSTAAHSLQKTLALRSNDFVVVERLPSNAGGRSNVFLPREFRPADRPARESSSGVIHVGLANVIGRPVVCEIPRDHATLLGIVKLLKQPEEALDGMRQIYALNTPEKTSFPEALPADAVLVFDPSLIQASKLPNFPPPHHVAPSTGSGPLILTVSQNEAPVEPDVSTPVPASAATGERLDASAETSADEVSVVEVTSVDESIAPAPQENSTARAEKPEEAMVDWRLAVLSAAAIAVLAWSLRMRTGARPRRRPRGRLEPVMLPIIDEPEKPRLLESLIEDRLPVFEEPCRLPAVLEFYGRPSGAARMEVPHAAPAIEVAPPHFIRARQTDAGHIATTQPESTAQVDELGRRADASHALEPSHRPHTIPQTDGRPSVLDRILTRLDKEARA